MTWYDVDDILFDGTEEEIRALKCPVCRGHISYAYTEDVFKKRCTGCGHFEVDYKVPLPNCVKFIGEESTI